MYAKNLTLKTGLANPMADISSMLYFIKKHQPAIHLVHTVVGKWEEATSLLLKRTTKVILERTTMY